MVFSVNTRRLMCFTIFYFGIHFTALAQNTIDGIRIWPAPESTRIVFDLKNQPDFSYFSLTGPQRLVIDFNDTKNLTALTDLLNNNIRIRNIRTSKAKNTKSTRIVIDLHQDYQISVFPLSPAGQYSDRLVIDLYDKDTERKVISDLSGNEQRDIVVAIVAGHGGEDPGSIGARGSYEKRVTLSISEKLAKSIDSQKGYKAVMIRKGDYFVNHDRKTELARQSRADLLISIHADAFTSSKPEGASVLVQSSRRANSEFSRWIANREAESELLGGAGETIKTTKDNNLALTLADMQKEYTMESSYEFATHVVNQLRQVTKMHKDKPEGLSLAVLKSSDIPSVLIETGFISNPNEEKKLNDNRHQQKIADAISKAVNDYFTNNPPAGTLIAATSMRSHKIVSGESLSEVAARYNISVAQLKDANNLKSNVVLIGQTLKIPKAE